MRSRVLSLISFAFIALSLSCCGGGGKPPISVTVSDGGITTVAANGSIFFVANVINSKNQTVTWAVVGGAANGMINASTGLYTAPNLVPNPAAVTVTATPAADPSVNGKGTITIVVAIVVSPSQASVQPLQTQQFSAPVQGSANQTVTWAVNGTVGGSISVGTISATGLYQAPESVPVNPGSGPITVTVSATPQVNTMISGSATVTVTPNNQAAKAAPIDLGTSGGSVADVGGGDCASGTLGSLLTRNGTQFILSNNHVLADMDAGAIGDAIIQPGLVDTASPCVNTGTTTVANLSQFVMLQQPAGCGANCTPPVDAAIAQVVSGKVVITGDILDLTDTATMSTCCAPEPPASTILPVASIVPNTTAVAKSGRTTGLTCSIVQGVAATIAVKYTHGLGGSAFTATFSNQIVIAGGTFSAPGDSGSLIVSQAGAQPVALLYAGNSSETIANPVATVLASFPDNNNPPNFPTFVGPASRGAVAGCTSSGTDAFSAVAQASPAQASAVTPSASQISLAEAARDSNAAALMTDSAVLAVGVAPSLDRPDRAAVVVFVRQGQPLARPIPRSVGGVPTRVVAVGSVAKAGVLDQETTASFVKTAAPPAAVHPSASQIAAAAAVKEKFVASLMKDPAIFGVAVTASLDNPGEPAILIFVETGKTPNPIPLELGGYRVQVQVTDRFRAFGWGAAKPAPRKKPV